MAAAPSSTGKAGGDVLGVKPMRPFEEVRLEEVSGLTRSDLREYLFRAGVEKPCWEKERLQVQVARMIKIRDGTEPGTLEDVLREGSGVSKRDRQIARREREAQAAVVAEQAAGGAARAMAVAVGVPGAVSASLVSAAKKRPFAETLSAVRPALATAAAAAAAAAAANPSLAPKNATTLFSAPVLAALKTFDTLDAVSKTDAFLQLIQETLDKLPDNAGVNVDVQAAYRYIWQRCNTRRLKRIEAGEVPPTRVPGMASNAKVPPGMAQAAFEALKSAGDSGLVSAAAAAAAQAMRGMPAGSVPATRHYRPQNAGLTPLASDGADTENGAPLASGMLVASHGASMQRLRNLTEAIAAAKQDTADATAYRRAVYADNDNADLEAAEEALGRYTRNARLLESVVTGEAPPLETDAVASDVPPPPPNQRAEMSAEELRAMAVDQGDEPEMAVPAPRIAAGMVATHFAALDSAEDARALTAAVSSFEAEAAPLPKHRTVPRVADPLAQLDAIAGATYTHVSSLPASASELAACARLAAAGPSVAL